MHQKEKLRVAIFASDDFVWSFPTWVKTIPFLARNFHLTGLGLFPRKFGSAKKVTEYLSMTLHSICLYCIELGSDILCLELFFRFLGMYHV